MILGARLQFYATAPCRARNRSAMRDGLSFNRQPHLKPTTMRLLSRSTFSRSLRTSALEGMPGPLGRTEFAPLVRRASSASSAENGLPIIPRT
jgi:hypothetical protein